MPSCPNCGGPTPDDARFCPRCGAPQHTGADSGPPRTGQAPERWELCEIVWWRGYLKSEFFAAAEGRELARSPGFRWRRADPPPPDDVGARKAHDELVRRLTALGWEPLGQAIPWYAQRFCRSTSGLRVVSGDAEEQATDEDPAQGKAGT
jgi:zinc-ribbon domain